MKKKDEGTRGRYVGLGIKRSETEGKGAKEGFEIGRSKRRISDQVDEESEGVK